VRAAGSAAQRETLLGIALELFAQRGVVNTTLTEIARAAGVTAAMVHYYFKSRDHLLDVLIAERLEPIRSRMIAALNGTDDPVELLVGLARQMVEIGAEHSWYAPLWMREVLSEGGGLRERLQQHHGRNQQEEFIERLRQAQSQGRLNAGLEPELIVLSLFGLTLLPLAKLCAPQSTHAPQITPDMIARHAVALLVGGLVGGRP
jgi:AcrR family transcriptional regulator